MLFDSGGLDEVSHQHGAVEKFHVIYTGILIYSVLSWAPV